jgi:2,3-bisphosphoglycerate-independent phosphoglycerate mutase
MDLIHVPGATGYLDTDYVGKARAAVAALDQYDMVVVHVEAADEAGHLGNATEKVKALERIDADILGPLLERLRKEKDWRVLVAPDHPTPCSTKSHSPLPPPFCYAGSDVAIQAGNEFSEAEAESTGVVVEPGTALITEFLGR